MLDRSPRRSILNLETVLAGARSTWSFVEKGNRLTDNPYRPSKSIYAVEATGIAIHLKTVLIGFAIGLIGGCILAVLWGMVGFVVYLSFGPSADTFYKGPIAPILGWCVGIVPFVIGILYVCRTIEDSWVVNSLAVAALNIATSIPFIFFDNDPFDWTIAIYYLIEFVLAGAIGAAWTRRGAR